MGRALAKPIKRRRWVSQELYPSYKLNSRLRDLRVHLENSAPAAFGINRGSDGLDLVAEALEVAVLEVDAGRAAFDWRERHLDLGDQIGIVFPIAVDLPRQQHAERRLPGQHLAPIALRAVLADLEPAST